jgi:lysophospholipase L1-like esterase
MASIEILDIPEIATQAELDAAIISGGVVSILGQRPNTVALLGDSLSDVNLFESASQDYYYSNGYWVWTQVFLRSRCDLVLDAGVGGEGSGPIAARVDDVIAAAPGWCVVECGINDLDFVTEPDYILDNIDTICQALTGANINPILWTNPGRTDLTDARRDNNEATNAGIRTYARAHGYPVIDAARLLNVTTTGRISTAYTLDTIHLSHDGAMAVGVHAAAVLSPLMPEIDRLTMSTVDASNLVTNGAFVGSTGGVATSWTESADAGVTRTASKVARTDGLPGEWQQVAITVNPGTWQRFQAPTITTGFSPGDVLELSVEFQTDASGWGGTYPRVEAQIIYADFSNYNQAPTRDATAGAANDTSSRPTSGVITCPPFVAGATNINVFLYCWGLTGTVRWGRCTVRNLTTAYVP